MIYAPVAQRIEQRPPTPCAVVRFHSGVPFKVLRISRAFCFAGILTSVAGIYTAAYDSAEKEPGSLYPGLLILSLSSPLRNHRFSCCSL